MKKNRENIGISEILGTILLLGIMVTVFAIMYIQINNYYNIEEQTFVSIVGTTEENCIILEHRGGELLSIDSEVTITVAGSTEIIKVGDYLDEASKENKLWDLGEKMIYPIQIDAFDLKNIPNANIVALDGNSNSLVMMGLIDVDVVCDLGLEISIDNPDPELGTNVIITLTLTNHGNINITGVEIKFLLPEQLIYVNNETVVGFYDYHTGIWDVTDIISPDESVQLIVEATVKEYGTGTSTQMVIIMDGSESTNDKDWTYTMDGLASSIESQDIFPNTGGIELTIVQFGGDKPSYARQEIGPIVITEENCNDVAADIRNIEQLKGKTPTACGFYLAADLLKNSDFFSEDKKQIALLVSRGNPTECCEEIYEGYIDIYEECTCADESGPKESLFEARDFLVKKLKMTAENDRVNIVGVGHSSPQHEEWLKLSAWPQDGIEAPSFIIECDKNDPDCNPDVGWYCRLDDWEDFIETVDDIFADAFSEILVNVEIQSTDFTDPKMANNFCTLLIY